MTSYPMPGPKIHNKSGSKPLMQNPLPFFLAQWPSIAVTSISWLGQQTNMPGKKRQPYHPYKSNENSHLLLFASDNGCVICNKEAKNE